MLFLFCAKYSSCSKDFKNLIKNEKCCFFSGSSSGTLYIQGFSWWPVSRQLSGFWNFTKSGQHYDMFKTYLQLSQLRSSLDTPVTHGSNFKNFKKLLSQKSIFYRVQTSELPVNTVNCSKTEVTANLVQFNNREILLFEFLLPFLYPTKTNFLRITGSLKTWTSTPTLSNSISNLKWILIKFTKNMLTWYHHHQTFLHDLLHQCIINKIFLSGLW